ncbi:MAG: hypothetical protein KDM91_22645, partial [Verrucomicrobiae bacterium]|nr:hypothetical protein [Verrucomicrobiae bacterium]
MEGLKTDRSTVIGAVAIALFAAAAGYNAGPVPRETDQASLINGAWQLKHGAPARGAVFYNYDKQFLAYAIVAAFLPSSSAPLDEREIDRLVGRANLGTALLLSASLAAWWFSRRRRPGATDGLALVALLAAPAFLLSAPFASAAAISAAFVILLTAVLGRVSSPIKPWLAAGATFLAVGARADAVLCLPLLCWSNARVSSWRSTFRDPVHWAMAIAAVAALGAGYWLAGARSATWYGGYFEPRVFGAYLVFGLGAMLLPGGFALAATARFAFRRGNLFGFAAAGPLFLLLPLGFYGWQLFSPRHLIPLLVTIFGYVASRRGRAAWRWWRRENPRAALLAVRAAFVCALVPLFAGLDFADSDRFPAVTVRNPTLYPTTDGLWPMGAAGTFLFRLGRAAEQPVDHNQALWLAIR